LEKPYAVVELLCNVIVLVCGKVVHTDCVAVVCADISYVAIPPIAELCMAVANGGSVD